jgi:autotransporter-associated beta strand protein
LICGLSLGAWPISAARAQTTPLTPAQLANPVTGQIPNSSPIAQEYYLGPISAASSVTGTLVGAVYPNKASVTWYQFQSDGVTPIIFDTYGTQVSFGGGFTFGASNDMELAVYNNSGVFIADNKGSVTPASGDSNIPAVVPSGDSPAPVKYRQPLNPTEPVYTNESGSWYADNYQGLSNLAFVENPQSNPLWSPSNPNYNSATPNANWNQFPILPAGTYFLAVTGYSTYWSGDPDDAAEINGDPTDAGGDTSTTPFGFLTYQAFSGTYQVNERVAGDFDGDAKATTADLQLLESQVRQYAPYLGLVYAGFTNNDPTQTWNGLPTDAQPYDLTGNNRIDAYDVAAFGRYTGVASPAVLSWDNAGATGNGVTWDTGTNQNFNDGLNPATFSSGAYLFFNDSNNGNYNVAISGTVSPIAVTVNNSSGDYVFSGTGGIGGTGYFVKAGSSTLTINTVNTYTDYTYVAAGTLVLSSSGSLASNSLTVASGAVANINGLLTANPDVTANGQLAIGALSGTGIQSRALSSLTIGSGGTVSLANSTAHANRTVLSTSALSLSGDSIDGWQGQLDLGGNDMIVHGGVLADITSQIQSGLNSANSGYWNGQGIISSTAAADSTKLTALGVLSNSNGLYSTFDGQSVSTTDILLKYTYYGDANLDGVVNGSDYAMIDNGFNAGLSGWQNGDFNYDGVINGDDYILIDNSFNSQPFSLAAGVAPTEMIAATSQQISSVPEPASVGLLAIAAAGLYGRRRTTKRKTNYQLRANQPTKEVCLN